MSFLESPVFPDKVAYGSKGGPEFHTSIVETASGHEARNQDWQYPRWKFDLTTAILNEEDFYGVYEYFLAVKGPANGFRFRDPYDHKSGNVAQAVTMLDQIITAISGSSTEYQLVKTYSRGAWSLERKILKPIDGTLLIADNGSQVTEVSGTPAAGECSVEYTTGVVTFGYVPTGPVTWGGEFHVPVRFADDYFDPVHTSYEAVRSSIILVELRKP